MAMETVGILGGTFDPVHLGHLRAADRVRRVFSLPRVLLVPAAVPPHKSRPDLLPAGERVRMVELAVRDWEGLEASPVEVERGGVSYTLDTLRRIRSGDPPANPLFILGLDALREIRTWHEYEALLREFDLVAVDRPGGDPERIARELGPDIGGRIVAVPRRDGAGRLASDPPPGAGGRIYHLAIPPVDVSSSEVRRRAARGDRLDELVPPLLARYIRDRGLYQKEENR